MCLTMLIASVLTGIGGQTAVEPLAEYVWTRESVTEGEGKPAIVPFRGEWALRFERRGRTLLDLGQGDGEKLRLTGPLTLATVVQLESMPTTKVSLISKWLLRAGGRSYELGVSPSGQVFFTISASGSWPKDAKELLSTRTLRPGVPYHLAAVYEPGRRMAVFINGHPSGESTLGVPESVFDSDTPVYLGNRFGGEKSCGIDGLIAGVWFHEKALDAKTVAGLAADWNLTAEPKPEFPPLAPPYDLDAIKERVQAWYGRLQAPGQQYGAYRLTTAKPADLYASADIAWIRWVMDDLDLTDEQRSEWIDFIQDQQNHEDGSYRHITGHCKTHAFCHATGALNMLGGPHRFRPRLLEQYLNVEKVPEWLDGINWVRQWGASHDIWGAGVPLICSPETPQVWKDAVFAWLDAEVDPRTGYWRKGVEARSPLEYLGGAFHIWPAYAAVERPILYPERVIDSVLKLEQPNGSFDGHFNYGNMDGVWVLEYLSKKTPHRRDEVSAALARNLHGLMKMYNTLPWRFLSDAHGTESRIATLGILQSAHPELLKTTKPWRNPWYRRELFVLRHEE